MNGIISRTTKSFRKMMKLAFVKNDQFDFFLPICLGKNTFMMIDNVPFINILHSSRHENRTNEDAIQISSRCSDLSQLGQTLNGIYLVKPKIVGNKMDALYCNFKPSRFWSGASGEYTI